MEGLIKTSHGFIMDTTNNGLKVARISSHGGGRVEVGDLQVQVIKSIQWRVKVKMGLNREGEAAVSMGPLQVMDVVSRGEFVTEMMGRRGNFNGIYHTRRKREVAIASLKDNLISNRDGDEGTIMVD